MSAMTCILKYAKEQNKRVDLWTRFSSKNTFDFDFVAELMLAKKMTIREFMVSAIDAVVYTDDGKIKILMNKIIAKTPRFLAFDCSPETTPITDFSAFSHMQILKRFNFESDKLDLRACENLQELILASPKADYNLSGIQVAKKLKKLVILEYEIPDNYNIKAKLRAYSSIDER